MSSSGRSSATPMLTVTPTGPAGRQEWRTPPLWGFRDSGPYLHDGRADNLEQSVALHGGQGQASAAAFFTLTGVDYYPSTAFARLDGLKPGKAQAENDRIAEMAKEEGVLVLGLRYMNPVVGYICLIRDPDGNQLEFSVEQDLG